MTTHKFKKTTTKPNNFIIVSLAHITHAIAKKYVLHPPHQRHSKSKNEQNYLSIIIKFMHIIHIYNTYVRNMC